MSQRPGSEPPPAELEIAQRVVDGTLVIAVSGEVDLDSAPTLSEAILACIDRAGGGPCVLDLAEVTFLDSAGLTVLLNATIHAEGHRETLRIVVDSNRPVIRPIEITGLDEVLTPYHTVDEALEAGTA